MSTQNAKALLLKSLHAPGNPLILTNIWDAITARAIAPLPTTKALATASYAIAAAAGLEDHELTLDVNLAAIRAISRVAHEFDLPLTADFQDGFGTNLEEGIRAVLDTGVVGINLEDFGRERGEKGELYPIDVAVERIRTVLSIAASAGVPDFVVNARTDALLAGRPLSEAIERGKAYLAAGAHNVFIWGGRERGGTTRAEVEEASRELGGRLNVILIRVMEGGLKVEDLKKIGVARISVGPQLMHRSLPAVVEEAKRIGEGKGREE